MKTQRDHKASVAINALMTRRLRLRGPVERKSKQIETAIDNLMGVDSVSLRADKHALRVVYDASQRQLADIEKVLIEYDCGIDQKWWMRLKQGWYRFTDQNVMDNAAHEPWSCHKRPPGH